MRQSLLPGAIAGLAAEVVARNAAAGRKVAVAESCTGGLVAAALTEIAGSSAVFERGFVTYSNEAKQDLLRVPGDLLASEGAVSAACAEAMAAGALASSRADIAVAITGIAGPGGGSADKPVGMVCFARARRGAMVETQVEQFGARTRAEIRAQAAVVALELLLP
jgi:nicotinamide-nucleotide amidase